MDADDVCRRNKEERGGPSPVEKVEKDIIVEDCIRQDRGGREKCENAKEDGLADTIVDESHWEQSQARERHYAVHLDVRNTLAMFGIWGSDTHPSHGGGKS